MGRFEIEDFKEEYICDVLKIEEESCFSSWTKEMFLDGQNKEHINFKTAFYDGVAVGFIVYSVVIDEAEILNIAIKKEFRNKSFATTLIEFTQKDLITKNAKKIFLEVSDKNIPALNLYKKLGFVQYAQRKKYYKNGDDALLMAKDLLDEKNN